MEDRLDYFGTLVRLFLGNISFDIEWIVFFCLTHKRLITEFIHDNVTNVLEKNRLAKLHASSEKF